MSIHVDTLAAFIKARRRNKKLSQNKLGRLSGLSRMKIAHIETGRSRLSLLQVSRIGAVLDFEVNIKTKESINEGTTLST